MFGITGVVWCSRCAVVAVSFATCSRVLFLFLRSARCLGLVPFVQSDCLGTSQGMQGPINALDTPNIT
jgi:hypothetical protein